MEASIYVAGDGTDQTAAIQRLLDAAQGRTVHFSASVDSYAVSDTLTVHEGTTIYGDGDTSLFTTTAECLPLFNCEANVTVRDIKAVDLGSKAGASSTQIADNGVVYTNSGGGTFQRITSEDFSVCVRITAFDGSGWTSRSSDYTVEDIVAIRPDFGILVSGCLDSTFARISGYDMQNRSGAPPHAVYVTNEGSEGSPYMSGLTFSDLYAEGCEASGFQFKGMLGGSVTGMEAVDCSAVFSVLDADGLALDDYVGTDLLGNAATGGMYVEVAGSVTIGAGTLRFALTASGTSENPWRGAVIIGNDVVIAGLDIEFPLADNPSAACLWFGASAYDTADYTLTNLRVVNTGASNGYAAAIRNVTSGYSLTTSTVTGFPSDHNDTGTTAGVTWAP